MDRVAHIRHLDRIARQPNLADIRMIVFDNHLSFGNRRFGEGTVEIVDRRDRNFGRAQPVEPVVDRMSQKDPFEFG